VPGGDCFGATDTSGVPLPRSCSPSPTLTFPPPGAKACHRRTLARATCPRSATKPSHRVAPWRQRSALRLASHITPGRSRYPRSARRLGLDSTLPERWPPLALVSASRGDILASRSVAVTHHPTFKQSRTILGCAKAALSACNGGASAREGGGSGRTRPSWQGGSA
jgi:hypothetical protein